MRTTNGVNAFLEDRFKDFLVAELKHYQQEKGLRIHAWVILNNQVHIIGSAGETYNLAKIIGDFRRKAGIRMLKFAVASFRDTISLRLTAAPATATGTRTLKKGSF